MISKIIQYCLYKINKKAHQTGNYKLKNILMFTMMYLLIVYSELKNLIRLGRYEIVYQKSPSNINSVYYDLLEIQNHHIPIPIIPHWEWVLRRFDLIITDSYFTIPDEEDEYDHESDCQMNDYYDEQLECVLELEDNLDNNCCPYSNCDNKMCPVILFEKENTFGEVQRYYNRELNPNEDNTGQDEDNMIPEDEDENDYWYLEHLIKHEEDDKEESDCQMNDTDD